MAANARSDVLIVGGGIAGLTAAAFAARAGAKTRLVESAVALGGRARTRESHGFKFNFGAHALYLGGVGKQTLNALSVDLGGGYPDFEQAAVVCDNKLHVLSRGLTDFAATSALSEENKKALRAAFVEMGGGAAAHETIGQAVRRLASSAPAQDALFALIRLTSYSNAPDVASADALLNQLRLAGGGVQYLNDGWGSMITSLTAAARGAGAVIEVSAAVARVEEEPTGWKASTLSGEILRATALVLAVSPSEAAALMPTFSSLKAAADAAVPVRVSALDVALSRLVNPTCTFALGLDTPTYLSVHSLAARLGPEGGALIHVVRYLETDEKPAAATRKELETLLDLAQPGWREVLVSVQWLPLATVTHDQPQAARFGLSGRCTVAIARGLSVAGDWVGAEGMLSDAAFASGRSAGESSAAYAKQAGA